MKRPTFLEVRKIKGGFIVYYTRKLYHSHEWAVVRYGLREPEQTAFSKTKPIKQGDKTSWSQVPKAVREIIIEDYKGFYPSYNN